MWSRVLPVITNGLYLPVGLISQSTSNLHKKMSKMNVCTQFEVGSFPIPEIVGVLGWTLWMYQPNLMSVALPIPEIIVIEVFGGGCEPPI